MIQINNALPIDGWMTELELTWLANTAKTRKRIIEVGCYKGRSTRVLADNTSGIVIAVDPWFGPFFRNDDSIEYDVNDDIYSEFIQNLGSYIDRKVIPYRNKFEDLDFLDIDFLFIDADHRYEAVKRHIIKGLGILNPGSIISGHDYGQTAWPGVKQAVDEIFGNRIKVAGTIWYVEL